MKKGDQVLLKVRDFDNGLVLAFPVKIQAVKDKKAYIVGNSFAFWFEVNNSRKNDIWLARK